MRTLAGTLRSVRHVAALAATALAAACSSSPTPPPNPGTLSVAVSPTSVTVAAGASGTATATVTRGGSFAGDVAVSQSGAPTGVTVTLASATVAAGSTTDAITVTVGASVAAGSYPVTITAAGSGVTSATATLTVVVPQPATLAVAVAPTSLNVAAGANGTATATITRGGSFTDVVALTSTGAPTGVTVTFATPSLAAGVTTSGITIAVAGTATPGTYPITVSAAGTGVTTATASLSLTVVAAGAGSFTLTSSAQTLAVTGGGAAVTANLTVARTAPFTGAVALAVTGAPAGMTATVNPTSVTGTSSVLSVQATTATINGTYPVVVRGSATGVSDAADTIAVTVTGGTAPGVTLTQTPTSSGSVAAGTTFNNTLGINRVGGFTGAVTLSQSGAPTGVTVTFAPNPVATGVTSSTVTFAVASTTTPGTYPIVLSAAGTGITTANATYTLTVTAAPSVGLSLAPSSATIVQGGTATSTATITRGGGFTGAVSLSATGAPAGVAVAYNPATIASGSTTSTLTWTVASNVPAGSYPISIFAAGTGVTTATATYTLTVSTATTSNFSITYCAANAPIWVAAKDGAGAWTQVISSGGNAYNFSFTSSKVAIATVDTVGTGYSLDIIYATPGEFSSFGNTLTYTKCGGKSVNGSVANVTTSQLATVALGYSTKSVFTAVSSNFTLTNVSSGPQDLFASRTTISPFGVDKIILRRSQDFAAGATMPVLDFNATEAFAPGNAILTVGGPLGSDTASVVSLYNGNRGSTFGLIGNQGGVTASTLTVPYYGVPDTKLFPGELNQVFASATAANNPNASRSTGLFFTSVVNDGIAFGPVLTTPSVTAGLSTPNRQPAVSLGAQAEYNRFFTATFSQAGNRSASITATVGFNGAGTWAYNVPDLSTVSGWLTTWGLQTGVAMDWNVTAQGGAIIYLDTSVAAGSTFQSASQSGTIP